MELRNVLAQCYIFATFDFERPNVLNFCCLAHVQVRAQGLEKGCVTPACLMHLTSALSCACFCSKAIHCRMEWFVVLVYERRDLADMCEYAPRECAREALHRRAQSAGLVQ